MQTTLLTIFAFALYMVAVMVWHLRFQSRHAGRWRGEVGILITCVAGIVLPAIYCLVEANRGLQAGDGWGVARGLGTFILGSLLPLCVVVSSHRWWAPEQCNALKERREEAAGLVRWLHFGRVGERFVMHWRRLDEQVLLEKPGDARIQKLHEWIGPDEHLYEIQWEDGDAWVLPKRGFASRSALTEALEREGYNKLPIEERTLGYREQPPVSKVAVPNKF